MAPLPILPQPLAPPPFQGYMCSSLALSSHDLGTLDMEPTGEAIWPLLSPPGKLTRLCQATSLHRELVQPQKSRSFQEAATALPRKFFH